jgi:hypothetical protein
MSVTASRDRPAPDPRPDPLACCRCHGRDGLDAARAVNDAHGGSGLDSLPGPRPAIVCRDGICVKTRSFRVNPFNILVLSDPRGGRSRAPNTSARGFCRARSFLEHRRGSLKVCARKPMMS